MGFFNFKKNKDNKDNFSIRFAHLDGIPNYKQGFSVKVTLDDNLECLVIDALIEKKDSVKLRYNQIMNVLLTSDKDIIEKSKNVLGRAVLGGVFIGPLGSIVGGMSGIGDKKNTKVRNIVVINYKSEKDDEDKVLSFEIVGASLKWDKFIDYLKERANIEKNEQSIGYL